MSTVARTPQLDSLVTDWLDRKAEIVKHTTAAAELAAEIERRVGAGNKYEVLPGVGVMVTEPAAAIDETRAGEVLTPDQFAACCVPAKPKFTAAGAKAALPGALLDLIKVPGRSTVRVIQ